MRPRCTIFDGVGDKPVYLNSILMFKVAQSLEKKKKANLQQVRNASFAKICYHHFAYINIYIKGMICSSWTESKSRDSVAVWCLLSAVCCVLLPVLWLVPTICCLLSAVCCYLFYVWCLLSAVWCVPLPVFWLVPTICCLLSAVCCYLSSDWCLLYAVYCLLSAATCPLIGAYYLLSAVCCYLSSGWCLLSAVYCLLSVDWRLLITVCGHFLQP